MTSQKEKKNFPTKNNKPKKAEKEGNPKEEAQDYSNNQLPTVR